MTKPASGDFRKVSTAPEGEPWVWLTRELVASHAWRSRSLHCVRLIDFLLIEHMNHAGRENGCLAAPYSQLVQFGLGRRYISSAIKEAEAVRLIEVERGGKKNAVADHLSRFRLTFLPCKRRDLKTRSDYWAAASNEWEKTTPSDVKAFRRANKEARKKRVLGAPRVNSTSSLRVNPLSAPRVNRGQANGGSRECTTGEHPSISWPHTPNREGRERSASDGHAMRPIGELVLRQLPTNTRGRNPSNASTRRETISDD